MKRRSLSLKDKLEIMVRQATCPICKEKLGRLDGLQIDHEQALARGGSDTNENLRFVHIDCHKAKTFGTKYNKRNADNFEAKKTNRLSNKQDEFVSRILAKEPGKPREKSGKIPSRPFRKRKEK